MRLGFFTNNIKVFIKNFSQIFVMGWGLLRYLWWDKRFVISGLKGARDK
jgi:hypothetical protein